jgi:hypothetical protein
MRFVKKSLPFKEFKKPLAAGFLIYQHRDAVASFREPFGGRKFGGTALAQAAHFLQRVADFLDGVGVFCCVARHENTIDAIDGASRCGEAHFSTVHTGESLPEQLHELRVFEACALNPVIGATKPQHAQMFR